ncbi:MAG: TraR/DksA family transcriptional regulator [Planctomycetota bacterium]|jgi:RNA polymerase-binding protein DksA
MEKNLLTDAGITMKGKRKNKDIMTPVEIRKFKAILLAKRTEILGDVLSMEDEALRRQISDLSRLPIHMADMGTDNFDMENTLGLVESERKLLLEINAALQRIEDGTYGICEGTGQPIPKERLEAIPWARSCAAYACLLEQGFVKKKYSFDETDSEDEAYEEQDKTLDNSAGD